MVGTSPDERTDKGVELRGVSKVYAGHTALTTTDLVAEAGKTTVLIGPSGCGKSTLLRIVIGLIRPTSGTVRVAGLELTDRTIRDVRHRVGYVLQDGGLFPHLSATDNVALLARHLGWAPQRIRERISALAELVRLPLSWLQRFPAQLSGGQRQRVSLMRALMLDPPVLLLDEPLGALDPIVRSEVQADLKQIFSSLHKTVIMVTHDLGEAWFIGDMLALLREGAIVQRGSLDEMVQTPADPFVTKFITAQRSPLP
jgi:osmoprotectant transport system ATP-binding protein